jgi:hypothetical protein
VAVPETRLTVGHVARAPLSRSVLWKQPEGRDASSPSTAGAEERRQRRESRLRRVRVLGRRRLPERAGRLRLERRRRRHPGYRMAPDTCITGDTVDVLAATTTFAFGRRTR